MLLLLFADALAADDEDDEKMFRLLSNCRARFVVDDDDDEEPGSPEWWCPLDPLLGLLLLLCFELVDFISEAFFDCDAGIVMCAIFSADCDAFSLLLLMGTGSAGLVPACDKLLMDLADETTIGNTIEEEEDCWPITFGAWFIIIIRR